MKTKNYSCNQCLFCIFFAMQTTFAQLIPLNPGKPQADWNKNGKDTIYTQKFVGIKTTSPDAELDVNGKIKGNAGHFTDYLQIGNNTFSFVPNQGSPTADHIRSDNGIISLLGGNTTSFNTNILVGIGTIDPAFKLDVLDDINVQPSTARYRIDGVVVLQKPGTLNIFVGELAGNNNTTGNLNTFVGGQAGKFNNSGTQNTFIGEEAGRDNLSGNQNTFLGICAGAFNVTGSRNTFVGRCSGLNHATGDNNTYMGNLAGFSVSNTTGDNNTYIGANSLGVNLSNAAAIGANALVTANNTMVLGSINGVNGAASDVNVGIGTTAPVQKLNLQDGNFLLSNSNNTAGEIRFAEPVNSGSNYTAFKATTQSADITYSLPAAQGAASSFLQNDGNGNLSWAAGGGGATGPTGPTGLQGTQGVQGNTGPTGILQSGTLPGQTPWWNNSTQTWTIDQTLFNNGTDIGIGTASPQKKLHLFKTGAVAGSTALRLQYDHSGVSNGEQSSSWDITATSHLGNLEFGKSDNPIAAMVISPGHQVGIGTNAPGNFLHINTSDPSSSTTAGGKSGLRFQDLTSASTPLATNPGTGVLSVNADGDVVYVEGAIGPTGATGATGFLEPGTTHGQTIWWNNSTGAWVRDQNIFNAGDKVGIGAPSPAQKLEITGNIKLSAGASRAIEGPSGTSTLSVRSGGVSSAVNLQGGTSSVDGSFISLTGAAFGGNGSEQNGRVSIVGNATGTHAWSGLVQISQYDGIGFTPRYRTFKAGDHHWFSGSGAGTETMTLTAAGELGVGATSVGAQIHVVRPFKQNKPSPTALRVDNADKGTDGITYGIISFTNGNAWYENYAGFFQAASTVGDNIAGKFRATTPKSGNNIGAVFEATGAWADNIAGSFLASGGTNNIAVEVIAGDAVKPGGGSWKTPSDATLKTNISPFIDGLNVIRQVNPVYYQYNGLAQTPVNKTYIGLVAQDHVQQIPYIIDTTYAKLDSTSLTETALLTTNSEPLLFAAINAIKQLDSAITNVSQNSSIDSLQAQIVAMQEQLIQIQNCISNLPPGMGCNGTARMANPDNNNSKIVQHDVILKGEIILDQNNPNPFKESTTINYFIPEYIHFAQIIFSDNTGRIINTVDIAHTGEGQLNVKAEKLGSGMYSYSIVVDGNVIDTKKMIKTK